MSSERRFSVLRNFLFTFCSLRDKLNVRCIRHQDGTAAERCYAMNEKALSRDQIRRLTLAAMLTAIVFVLQLLDSLIKLGIFSTASLVLIPIVIGAALLGWKAGAWLGFVFAAAVLISGDAAPFFAVTILGTIITVVVKGIAAGTASGLVYQLLGKKHPVIGTVAAAFVCPVVNTGVFLLGCRIFFWDTVKSWAAAANIASAEKYVLFSLVGINFLVELALNLILSPVAIRLIKYYANRKKN